MDSRHANYPDERSKYTARPTLPRGRCASCARAPQPCRWCQHDAKTKRCTCGTGNRDLPHDDFCNRYEVKP